MATVFFRLLDPDDKATNLNDAVGRLRNHELSQNTYIVNPDSFSKVPGSPFAYWVNSSCLKAFADHPVLTQSGFEAWVGLQTNQDFRWLRLWWEVPTEAGARIQDRSWLPFAKGGKFSPFYCDIFLVVRWKNSGAEIKSWKLDELKNGNISENNSQCWNESRYLRPGITWPSRTNGLSFRILPSGCIFGHKGPAIFSSTDSLKDLLSIVSLVNSSAFVVLVKALLARVSLAQSFEVGIVRSIPIPEKAIKSTDELSELAIASYNIARSRTSSHENGHGFFLPALLQVKGDSIADRTTVWQEIVYDNISSLMDIQYKIDEIVFRLYSIDRSDCRTIEEGPAVASETADEVLSDNDDDAEEEAASITGSKPLTVALLSHLNGCVFGRWEIRFATGERHTPYLPAPFDPIPTCSPGMLQGDDGLPLQETPENYPLRIEWDGILVDDPSHSDDIVRRVRDVLEVIWKNQADAIEQEACEILGVKELRDYFRKPGNGGFWTDHVSRYTKSRRKAPIYWLLQSSKKNYALWIYYHRLDKDILFKALLNYVEPKIRNEESRLDELRSQKLALGPTAKGSKNLDKDIDRQEAFLSELRDFEDKLRRAANLHLEPDLNDGVVLNIAPLRELVLWKEAKSYWDELIDGKYEWSSIGKQLREKGLVS